MVESILDRINFKFKNICSFVESQENIIIQGRLSDIKTKKERADLKLNILLLSDYGLNGVEKTTKIVLDDYLEFNHTQYIIQRGGSCVLVPFALRVILSLIENTSYCVSV